MPYKLMGREPLVAYRQWSLFANWKIEQEFHVGHDQRAKTRSRTHRCPRNEFIQVNVVRFTQMEYLHFFKGFKMSL